MDFIQAHSRFRRQKYTESIEICDEMLRKNPQDQAAWMLKCQCLIGENYMDELETEEEGMAEMLMKDEATNQLARGGTSFKQKLGTSNPIMRPMNSSGRLNTGFMRVGTSIGSRAGTRSNNMLRTGKIMTRAGIPATSNGRLLRLSTASLEQHGENFIDSSKINLHHIAQRKSKSRIIFLYLFYVEHNFKKALELAVYSTQLNNYLDPWWKLCLGKCYYHLQVYDKAEQQFKSSLKHNYNIDSYLYLSRIYQKKDSVTKSIDILKQGIDVHPFQPKLVLAIARILDEINNLDQSYKFYKQVIKIQNCNIQAVANIATYYYYNHQSEVSAKLYKRLIELGYESAEVWNNLALCYFSNSEYDVFYICFERAILLGKDDPITFSDVWYNLGNIYALLGQLDMAIEAYKISINYLPDNSEALNNLAVIESQKGNMNNAINYALKSFREISNLQSAFNLSIWYFYENEFQKSHKYNQEVLKLYSKHSESLQLSYLLMQKLEKL